MFFAERVLGITGYALLIPIVGAVAGHIFPFYMSFRGGRGTATAIGIVLFMMGRQLANGFFPVIVFGGLLAVSGMVYLVSRSGDATAIAGLYLRCLSPYWRSSNPCLLDLSRLFRSLSC
jgi:glycerol-3-phosphate acyltransferase PlsY